MDLCQQAFGYADRKSKEGICRKAVKGVYYGNSSCWTRISWNSGSGDPEYGPG